VECRRYHTQIAIVREAIVKVDSTSTSSLSSPKGGVQGARQGGQAAAGAAPVGGSAAPAQSADVSLSALSSQLRSLAASGEADIDVAQVESIKQAIADGSLTMDASKIADGILATARDLLKNPSTGG
jgi:negative regulator of flagellin synthesis FlgM